MMRTTLASLLIVAVWAIAFAAVADEDALQEAMREAARKAEPLPNLDLDHRIQPVSGKLLLKAGRQELSPTLGMSLGDPFHTKYLFGLRWAYHLGEQWSVGVGGFWAESTPSGAVTRCDSRGLGCRLPTKHDLVRAPGDFDFVVGADVSWAPLYGKISVLAETVLHFDTYVALGGGVIQTQHMPPNTTRVEANLAPHGSIAVGQRFYLNRTATLRLELRDLVYPLELQGRTGPETTLQNQLLFTLGLSLFFGQGQGI